MKISFSKIFIGYRNAKRRNCFQLLLIDTIKPKVVDRSNFIFMYENYVTMETLFLSKIHIPHDIVPFLSDIYPTY